ncbi:DUF4249 domain-containing protein [Prevotella sp. 10(H)]|uniref:DUF4249 domain-containing protein n=1 Tax=Prevotella sp. 10(H) TaxID=1158294 RepID=UPI0004A76909|nr:DUF4249 domain-containing protein [Prevotella sp. 10(H)]
MKNLYKLLFLFLILFSLSSCEKIVDIDLRIAEPRLVIDASISEQEPCRVYLTMTQGFRDNEPFKTVTGAEIVLTDQHGNSEVLRESRSMSGIYVSTMVGEVDKSYHIKVTVDGKSYKAMATIPKMVPIYETYIYEIKAGNESWYSPSYVFYDPADEENYYYTILSVNQKPMRTIYLDSDEHRNGLRVHRILFFNKDDNDDEDLKTGDEIMIELQAIDKGMHTFYKSLFSVAADGATNPITNFTGDVLGCFKAYNSSYAYFTVSPDIIYRESDE